MDHEFVDIIGQQWSLHAMVLHIGSTKNEGHFVAYILFADKWWLCDDTRVKEEHPPPESLKGDFPIAHAHAN